MGKKMKPKARNPRKVQPRASAGSTQPVSEPSDRTVDVGGEEVKGGERCNHYSKDSAELNRVLLGILSSKNATACEHCREEPVYKRGGMEKGKQQKKKKGGARNSEVKSESHIIWVCLDCSRYFCGGAVNDSVPYGHARRHAKQDRHSWAVRFDDPTISWCFSCNSGFPMEMPEVVADSEDKLAKDDNNCKGGENGVESLTLDGVKGHVVRGLTNLGNTCFFNSILQNIFAINMLRDYMLSLNRPIGPLTMAMKKLFVETSGEVDSRSTLSPKSLFSCICSKAPQFRGYDQQDSHELLCCLLYELCMEEKSAQKSLDSSEEKDNVILNSRTTMVDNIFGGQLSSTVSCVECGHTSVVHEPFLHLSLPVPSKKPPVPSKKPPLKKVPPPPPKKSKPPLKERNRSRRFREKGSTKESPEMEHNRVESFGSSECSGPCISASQQEHNVAPRVEEPSECYESGPSLKPEQNNASKMEDSFCWLDYLEPSMASDDAYSDSQMHEYSITQCSDTRQIYQSENNAEYTVELQTQNCSKEQIVTPDSFGENCNDVSSSNIQDSGVILLPYKELNPTVEEINGTSSCFQNPENLAPADALVKDSNVQTTSAACGEQAEVDFDGFGDLFNEPDVTSELKVDTSTGGEMDATLWTSNSCESNQEEVDDTNSPVSVDGCLTLFTKPELLSDEHAWYCEHCSEVMSHHNVGRRKGKQQYATRLNQSKATESQLDDSEVGTTKVSPDSEVGCLNSTEVKVLSNGKMTSTSVNMDQHVERFDDINATVDVSQKTPNPTEGSGNTDYKNVVKNENCSMLSNPMLGDQAQNLDVLLKDENFLESGREKSIAQDCSSSKEIDSCSTNDHQGVGCGESLATACSGSLNHTETILSNSCENGDFGEVNPGGKKLLGEMHPVEDSKDEEEEPKRIKVKRDATKRILIDRVPPILTIHLKRFGQDARGRLTKLKGHVSFQEMLSLRPYMDPRYSSRPFCFIV